MAGADARDIVGDDADEHPQAAWPSIQMLPVRHTKVVHFIRHGQGYHNVAGHDDPARYLAWEFEDANLTELGWEQAHALRAHIAGQPEKMVVDAVVVSPLSRALQTAVGAFGQTSWEEASDTCPALMIQQHPIKGKQVEHAAVASSGCPPFIAWEVGVPCCVELPSTVMLDLEALTPDGERATQYCREHLGRHPCDRRRSLAHLREQYPAVDFSLMATEEDALWRGDHRETHAEIRARGRSFVAWLLARPERRLAVVTHSSFLFFLLSCYGHQMHAGVQGELHRWYDNCEMRTVVLADGSGDSGGLDPLWFPGGHRMQREMQVVAGAQWCTCGR